MTGTSNSGPGYTRYPEYRVILEPGPSCVRVLFNGEIIADTRSALTLREANHSPVFYIPIVDIRATAIEPTQHTTYCPFKGTARYWTIKTGEKQAENAMWGYPAPYDEVVDIKNYAAFYPNKVDAIETD